jgi:MioC protein
MAKQITILIGTMTGTAEMVADDIKPILEDAGFGVDIVDMDGLMPEVFLTPGYILVCTSTYGQGEVPDNAMDLYEGLDLDRPDLSSVKYGVIGLGDETYSDTYNEGGTRFDNILTELGATRVGERMQHNASGDDLPEEMAVDWVKNWLTLLESE